MPVVETKTEQTPVAAREPATRHDVTAPQLGALGFETQAVLDLQATAGNTAVTELLTAGAAASDGAGPAGSDDAGGGSAAGVGGGGSLPSKPAAPVPDLSGFSPPDGLHRVVGLPPAQLLASLGGIVAAISHSATREHNALRARPPDWQIAPDVPTSPGAHDSASVAVAGPPASAAPPVPATADPEAATVVHRHVAFHQEIEGEARSHAIAAAAPMGEHAIAAGSVGAVAAAVAVHPASATAPDLHLEDDEGVSRVAADERGGDIAAAVQAGATTMAQLETEHAGKQAELRRHAEREATHLETENRAKRDAERGAALEHVTGLRREWGGERSTVIAEAQGAGERASETATSAIKAHQAEAEHQAAAARAEGRREADRARTRGQGGGILGAIGSAAQSLVDKVASAVRSVMFAAEHLATQALERGRHLIQATIANAGNLFAAAAGRARSLLAAARDRFQRAIADRIARARAAVTGLMITVRAAVKATLDTCAKALGASVQVLQAGWHATVDGVRGVVQGALQFGRGAIQALGTFGALVRDVAANPGQWLRNLAAGAQDGIRNHLWPDLQQGVREWINSKVDAVLGIGEAVWMLLKRGGITVADVGHMLWEGIKAAIPPTLISILIEKIVSLLVPAAGLALLIVQGIQAAWSSLSRITQAFDAFMSFLKGVRWGSAGALFGKALSAGAVALLDFVSNLLLQRIGGPVKRVAGKIKALANRIGGGLKRGVSKLGRSVKTEFQTLNQTARLAVKARLAAPRIRSDLASVASENGGELVGLEHEFKTVGSLHGKIGRRIGRGASPEEAGSGIKDALRFTVVYEPGKYVSSTGKLFDKLRARGFKAFDYDNRWEEGKPYVGINSAWLSPSGHSFEIQVHTSSEEGSWYAKEFLTHDDYAKLRSSTDAAERQSLRNRMIEANKHVIIPEGAKDIPSPVED